MRSLRSLSALLCLSLLPLAGCSCESRTLFVDVRTDYAPGVEFDSVTIRFADVDARYAAGPSDDFLAGARIDSFDTELDAAGEELRLVVGLEQDRRIVLQRAVLVRLSTSQVVTVTLSRACAGVRCPDADPLATECFNGSCVRPECTPETPEVCASEQCLSTSDCTPVDETCGGVVCSSGACLFTPSPGACEIGEACIPGRGCVEDLMPDSGSDSGVDGGADGGADGGVDGGSDSGSACLAGAGCDMARDCELGVIECVGGESLCVSAGPASAGTACRAAEGMCDVAEQCDGASLVCPDDASAPAGTPCPGGFCNGFRCGACEPGAACPGQPCATGTIVCEGERARCQPSGFRASTYVCRRSADTCDVAEQCTGTSPECPVDRFAPASRQCRGAVSDCDRPETCTGVGAFCPSDTFFPASSVCRPSRGNCDVPERCTGGSPTCPPDGFRSASFECRGASTLCDLAESCTGASALCPGDAVQTVGTECRSENGVCDIAETCDGVSSICPPDVFKGPEGFAGLCRWHIPDEACDPLELCDGTGPDCPPDVFLPNGTICHECGLGVCDGTCQMGRCRN